jgi:iron complex outermembrane receptor protein
MPMTIVPVPDRWDSIASPRLSARAALGEDVAIKASAGRYVRLPTLVELFGNRGTIIGSPDLRPERGPSVEAGLVWAPAKPLGVFDRILVEAAAFGTRARDSIAFVTSIGYVARAMNVASTQTYGGELVVSTRIAHAVAVTANYTRLVTQQLTEEPSFSNKALPRQPAHALHGRVDLLQTVYRHRASLWLDGSWQSTTYLDRANFVSIPSRALVGTGVRAEVGGGVAATLTLENLLDVRVQHVPLDPPPRPDLTSTPTALADVAGFPLPGRTVYLALDWSY